MTGEPIKLWLDDLRDPNLHGRIGWTWAKTHDEALALLRTGRVIRASLDHDLTVNQTMGIPDGEKTGMDVLFAMDREGLWPAGGVEVHSQNPTMSVRMRNHIAQRRAGGR